MKRIVLGFLYIAMGLSIIAAEKSDSSAGPQLPPPPDKEFIRPPDEVLKIEMMKQWIEREMPDLAAKLEEFRKTNPEILRDFVKEISKNGHHLFRERKGNDESKPLVKELLKNELQSLILADQYKKTTDQTQKAGLSASLKETLTKSFELKEKLQEQAVKRMEERIVSLKDMMQKRKELKDKIIQQRLDEITNDEEGVTSW